MLGPISRHPADTAGLTPRSTPGRTRILVDTAPRSQHYLDSLARLDAGTELTPADLQEIVDGIRREFTQRWAALPVGFVSRCYLGHPFEVHTLTPDGGILEHFRLSQPMPGRLESARKHSLSGRYLSVEVYENRLVCVRADGTTVTLGSAHE
jgi:hypothetical protein